MIKEFKKVQDSEVGCELYALSPSAKGKEMLHVSNIEK